MSLNLNVLDNLDEKVVSNSDVIPVILSGGSGTRLWPLSRASYPKQYLNLEETNNFTLLQNTFLRLNGLNNLRDPIIISNEEQRFMVAEQMREINVKPQSIILEPLSRNTAPAIALAAIKASQNYSEPPLKILQKDSDINFLKINDNLLKFIKEKKFRLTQFEYFDTDYEKILDELKWRHYLIYSCAIKLLDNTDNSKKTLVECGVCDGLTFFFAANALKFKKYLAFSMLCILFPLFQMQPISITISII